MKLNVTHWKRCFKWNVLNWMHIKYNLNDSSINAQSISICTFRRNRIEEKKSEKSYQSPKLRYGRVDRMKNSCDALADNAVLCLETDWWQRFFFLCKLARNEKANIRINFNVLSMSFVWYFMFGCHFFLSSLRSFFPLSWYFVLIFNMFSHFMRIIVIVIGNLPISIISYSMSAHSMWKGGRQM